VVVAGLAVGLDDELVVDAGDGPDERCGALVEVDVLPANSEVRASAVAGGGDECPRDPVAVVLGAGPDEEGAGLLGCPHWPGDPCLGLAWGSGVSGDVVVDEAELHGVLERPADDGVDVADGAHGQVPLVLRRLFGAADDRCDGVLAEGLLVGELLGELLRDRSVPDALCS